MSVRPMIALLAALSAGGATDSAKARNEPNRPPTRCVGRPNAGVLQHGRQLEARPYLQIKSGSEQNVWGHPVLVQLVNHAARAAAVVPGSVALIGDLSSPAGGPLPGHSSHQVGRDADVAFCAADAQGRPVVLQDFESFDAQGRGLSNPERYFDAYRNWLLLRVWLSELRVPVSHVFVSAELRELLLDYGQQSPEFSRHVPRAMQVLHAHPTHVDHFHVRIACPRDQGNDCIDDAREP